MMKNIKELYIKVLKYDYKVWMSELNYYDDIVLKIGPDALIISIEGTNKSDRYEAKRLELGPR